jgi:hypothetical protein
MAVGVAPKIAVVGNEVVLTAFLDDATARARLRFRIFVASDESDEVAVIRSEAPAHNGIAHATWKVDIGTRKPPVVLRFTATMPDHPGAGSVQSDDMRVLGKVPQMSAWFAHGLRGSSGTTNVARNAIAQAELHELLVLSTSPTLGVQTLTDFSAVFTIRPNPGGVGVDWDRKGIFPALIKSKDDERKESFAKIIEICHERGVQVYAGYEAASLEENVDAFMQFANAATEPPPSPGADRPVKDDVVQAHADAIHRFLFVDPATALPWDGFGFDIEIGALKSPYAPLMTSLIHKLADLIAPKPVTYASFGFTAPGTGPNGMKISQRNDFFNSQPFEIARGKSNVITRPMLYEAPMPNEAAARKYVREVIAFALDVVGLEPEQLQMGQEVQPQPRAKKRAPGIISVPILDKVIEHEQAPREVGTILFGLFFNQRKQRMRDFVGYDEIYRQHGP